MYCNSQIKIKIVNFAYIWFWDPAFNTGYDSSFIVIC